MTQNKRNRTCFKYHYDMVKICRETDMIYTKCRVCKEFFPSTTEYFRRDKSEDAERIIQPLCKKCGRIKDAMKRQQKKMREIEDQQEVKNVEEKSLFENDSVLNMRQFA